LSRQREAQCLSQACQCHIHPRPGKRDQRVVGWRWQALGGDGFGLKAVEDNSRYSLASAARYQRMAQLVEQKGELASQHYRGTGKPGRTHFPQWEARRQYVLGQQERPEHQHRCPSPVERDLDRLTPGDGDGAGQSSEVRDGATLAAEHRPTKGVYADVTDSVHAS
jgi:hypothetical protein